jgi:NAD(P)-dependent dehydrogenase (short-subunit alcohol dehydrogenase family)
MSARTVLVTGGATGIGWATARRFAAAGDRVFIADIDGERAAARAGELGAGHAAFRADVSVKSDVDAMLAACVKQFGRIDVLVNNAGRIDTSGTGVVDQPTEAFRALLALNLEGTYHAAIGAAALMQAQGGGAIVNVASGAALRAIPLRNAYSASKAGVVAITRTLACRRAGIRARRHPGECHRAGIHTHGIGRCADQERAC